MQLHHVSPTLSLFISLYFVQCHWVGCFLHSGSCLQFVSVSFIPFIDFIFLDLITVNVFVNEYKLWSSSILNFLQSPNCCFSSTSKYSWLINTKSLNPTDQDHEYPNSKWLWSYLRGWWYHRFLFSVHNSKAGQLVWNVMLWPLIIMTPIPVSQIRYEICNGLQEAFIRSLSLSLSLFLPFIPLFSLLSRHYEGSRCINLEAFTGSLSNSELIRFSEHIL
jgi:hypothetical protein